MDIWSFWKGWERKQPNFKCEFNKNHFYINDDFGSRVLLNEDIKEWLMVRKHKFYFKDKDKKDKRYKVNLLFTGNNINVVRPQGIWLSKDDAMFFKMRWG
jgi:hypothetical protein